MKKLKLFVILLLSVAGNHLFAQNSEIVRKYIDSYKDIAIAEMQRTGVPASITLAQGILETEAGTSDLVRASNNHFGIKCKGDWTGETVFHDDDAKGECFRKYNDPADSYKDHSDFLRTRPNYTSLFQIDPTDYEAWARGLKKAGYATNPKYAQILIKYINDYHLQDYTLIALNRKQPSDDIVLTKNTTTASSNADLEIKPVAKRIHAEYPSGQFKINETNVVFVEKGTAFLKVASDYQVSLSRLFEFNDMNSTDIASDDQLVFLQRKRKTGSNDLHIVQEGETLYDIAQAEGIRMESLLNFNFLKPGMNPMAGEKLYLKVNAPEMPKLALQHQNQITTIAATPSFAKEDFIFHVVQPRETIYAIAKKYSVAIDDVKRWNEMQSIDLKSGQQLRIRKKA
ncbi:MAG TPA: glucosaminidase domain-containing protein [Flavisolibacter sp.]|nr:glucosaminidase domain-containing protein [Flavisolibacter sp.]